MRSSLPCFLTFCRSGIPTSLKCFLLLVVHMVPLCRHENQVQFVTLLLAAHPPSRTKERYVYGISMGGSLHPYILLHFEMFFITCLCLFSLAAAHAICHHRAEVSVLTSSRSPCFGIWTILTPVFTLPALAKESDPSQPFSGWILRQ